MADGTVDFMRGHMMPMDVEGGPTEFAAFWRERRGMPVTGGSATVPKVGRNDPCPCSSGRKHERCCGAH